MKLPLDRRPLVLAVAGPNGAGKTTFYFSHLQAAGLRFVNADVIARELRMDAVPSCRGRAEAGEPVLVPGESTWTNVGWY